MLSSLPIIYIITKTTLSGFIGMSFIIKGYQKRKRGNKDIREKNIFKEQTSFLTINCMILYITVNIQCKGGKAMFLKCFY